MEEATFFFLTLHALFQCVFVGKKEKKKLKRDNPEVEHEADDSV